MFLKYVLQHIEHENTSTTMRKHVCNMKSTFIANLENHCSMSSMGRHQMATMYPNNLCINNNHKPTNHSLLILASVMCCTTRNMKSMKIYGSKGYLVPIDLRVAFG
jgi:hypothetical protein